MISQLFLYFAALGDTCLPDKGGFFGFPAWYKYLDGVTEQVPGQTNASLTQCVAKINGINDVWLILAAVIEMLLRIAALAAVGFVVWGGIQFISGQGEPDKAAKARNTIINALVGLVISVGAATLVSFIAGRFN